MKKRILIGIFSSLFLIVIGLIIVYYSATSSIKKGEEVAVERAKKEASLAEVDSVDWFHYLDEYYVIQGKNKKGEKIHIWVPVDEKKEMIVKKATEGLTEKEVTTLIHKLDNFSSDKRPKNIISIKLAIVEDAPAYEITYKDQKNRHSILYLDYYKGEWYRVYNL
jgi:uncharacterized protein YpmB